MNDKFILGQGQGHEVEQAFARNDWTNAQVKEATKGDFLAKVRMVIEGKAEIVVRAIDKAVETISNFLTRTVKVNRTRSPQEALDATGRKQYTDKSVVKSMPRGQGESVEVVFFNVGRFVPVKDLAKEYELRGLIAVDPYSLAAVNEADPVFADEHPNGTQWQDEDGNYCCAAFGRWDGERGVNVGRSDDVWYGDWWFAGLRKNQN